MEEIYQNAYERNVASKSLRDGRLFMKATGMDLKGRKYYICEYYYDGELNINYFLGSKPVSNGNGGMIMLFTDLDDCLTGGALIGLGGFQYEMKREPVTCYDIQNNETVNLNCSIRSFVGYDELAEKLIAAGEVDSSDKYEVPNKVLEYVRTNYSEVLNDKSAVLLLAID